MGFQGKPIEKPKTAGAQRVWELLSLFEQAEDGWRGMAFAIGEGYSMAWNTQKTLLAAVQASIQHDTDQANFILGILLAGVAGGVMGPLMAGATGAVFNAFRPAAAAAAEKVSQTLAEKLTTSVISGLGSEAAKRTATRYITESVSYGRNAFIPAGPDPSTYAATLQKNVSALFMLLRRVIGGIIQELEAGNRPLAEGEEYYRAFLNHPAVAAFPDDRDISDPEIEKNAGLALWITWGSQRDFPYWDKIWIAAMKKPGNYVESVKTQAAIYEIKRFDAILDEIARLSDVALVATAVMLDNWWHLDVRKLKDVGRFTSVDSLKAMSKYFDRPKKPMGFSASLDVALTLDEKMGSKAAEKIGAAMSAQ